MIDSGARRAGARQFENALTALTVRLPGPATMRFWAVAGRHGSIHGSMRRPRACSESLPSAVCTLAHLVLPSGLQLQRLTAYCAKRLYIYLFEYDARVLTAWSRGPVQLVSAGE